MLPSCQGLVNNFFQSFFRPPFFVRLGSGARRVSFGVLCDIKSSYTQCQHLFSKNFVNVFSGDWVPNLLYLCGPARSRLVLHVYACMFKVYCNYHCVRIASDFLFHPSIHLHCIAQDLIAPLDLMRFTGVSFVYNSQVFRQ